MIFRRAGSFRYSITALLFATVVTLCVATSMGAQQAKTDPAFRDCTTDEYVEHLGQLDALLASCQAQRATANSTQSPAKSTIDSKLDFPACDPLNVGQDDRVKIAAGSQPREIRYIWLRSVLGRAAKKETAPKTATFGFGARSQPKPISADTLLNQARQRLKNDRQQVAEPIPAKPNYTAEQLVLHQILARKEYARANEVSPRERFVEWFYHLLDQFFSGLADLGASMPWIGTLLRILLIAVLATVLILLLVRIERQGRIRLTPDDAPAPDAPSARVWQLWLKDAQSNAANGNWRQAIHLIYWASISRLESNRLWPADRARTPREYLELLRANDPRKPALRELTQEFERTWYGGRSAGESNFDSARKQAESLGVAQE